MPVLELGVSYERKSEIRKNCTERTDTIRTTIMQTLISGLAHRVKPTTSRGLVHTDDTPRGMNDIGISICRALVEISDNPTGDTITTIPVLHNCISLLFV